MTTPTEANSLQSMVTDFVRGMPGSQFYGNARYDATGFYSFDALVAQHLSSREVWITTAVHLAATGKHVAALRRTALAYGLGVRGGVKAPVANPNFAAIPPLSLADALLVVAALKRHAGDPTVPADTADRARRLAAVYKAAADGDGGLAAALYLALPTPTKEE